MRLYRVDAFDSEGNVIGRRWTHSPNKAKEEKSEFAEMGAEKIIISRFREMPCTKDGIVEFLNMNAVE